MDEVELYKQMLSKDPSSHAFIYLAEALWERDMYSEAIEICTKGLSLRPHDLRARVILGLSYLLNGELDRAETELLKAKEMLEINTVIYQGLAELHERKGDFEKAARYRQLFETIHPSEVESPKPEHESESLQEEIPPEGEEVATATMAELYVEQGHLDKAIDVYRKILDAAPETEGVEKRIAELEREIADFKKGRTLLSVLEGWRNRLQEEAPTSLPASEPPSIDSERLAAFLKKYVKDPDL